MANPEHLAILKQGVDKWNQWRKENPEVVPELVDAALNEGTYINNYLGWASNNIEGGLKTENLAGLFLRKINLSGADLRRVDFSGSDLRGADLSGANLCGAIFNKVALCGSNVRKCKVGWTIFTDVDLRRVTGTEEVIHVGPSSLGIDTLYKSDNKIPDIFLRGCGVPEQFITYIPSLVGQAIQYYSCFISYSSKDQAFAERLYADLQSKGVRCWFAPEDMKIGDRFRVRIDESIRVHEKLLLILSESSVASDWVEKEVETAMEKEQEGRKPVLFPVRLDDSVNAIKSGWAADVRRTRHICDFSKWKSHDEYEKGFERLLRDLKIESSAEGEA